MFGKNFRKLLFSMTELRSIFCILGGAALTLVVIAISDRPKQLERIQLEENKFRLYVKDHHCVRTGFVNNANSADRELISVFTCNTGLLLYTEIYKLANPEEK